MQGLQLAASATISAVTATGTTPPAVTITGLPTSSYAIRINITRGGT